MQKTYIVYDTYNKGIVYAFGTAKELAILLNRRTAAIYRNVSEKRLIAKRYEIKKMED